MNENGKFSSSCREGKNKKEASSVQQQLCARHPHVYFDFNSQRWDLKFFSSTARKSGKKEREVNEEEVK